jgi:calcium-dependent protein kinase
MEKELKFGKELFVGQLGCTIKDYYEVINEIGKGGNAKVYEVKNKKTNDIRACKYLSKANIKESDLQKFRREIKILIKTDHPNIIKLYEVFETKKSLYLIMEKCNGGELFDKIINHIGSGQMYSERMAANLISQIMSAVDYCHKNGICHRDLKPENILFLNKGSELDNPLKIIDFGLSQIMGEKKKLTSQVGTSYYVPPEILMGEYNQKCDIWSVGIILCILLTGEPPFNGPNDAVIINKIRKFEYFFSEKWRFISNEAKDLVSHMLVPENIRYNASEVLAHPWFKIVDENNNKNSVNLSFDLSFLISYKKTNTFKKIILTFIASRLNENDINDLNKLFEVFDIDNDGQISFKEFQHVLVNIKNNGIKENEIKELFNSLDTDKNGKIDYTEFIASCLQKKIYLNNERLKEAFSVFDKDNNGVITKDEIMSVLKLTDGENDEIDNIIRNADKNGDGVIDKDEFNDLMRE